MKKLRRILVVDGSRVVRATLAKHLKDDFEIREEDDGESAWQTLVLDSSIVAVVSAAHLDKLDAAGLLQRMRSNCLHRLKELPFLLIVSDTDQRLAQAPGEASGPNGFLSKMMKKSEIVGRLHALLDPLTHDECHVPRPSEAAAASLDEKPVAAVKKLLPSDEIRSRASQALKDPAKGAGAVCALVFGIDNLEGLTGEFGREVASQIGSRLAGLLTAKIGPHDCIGLYPGDRLAIVSRGADLQQCAHFARRVCASLASGQVTIRGKQVRVTASAGIASAAADEIGAGDELLALAERRLFQAFCCGGNTVTTENKNNCPVHDAERMLPKVMESLSSGGRKAIAPRIGTLGLHLLPFLKMMDQELSLGLPLLDIKHQLTQRAKIENEAD